MLRNYFKVALKVLGRRKFFTFVSLFGVSFTLFVLLLVTAMVDHVLWPHAPEVNSDRVLDVNYMAMRGDKWESSGSPGYRFLDQVVRRLETAEAVSLYSSDPVTTFLDGEKITSRLVLCDGPYWEILAFDFVEGAPFTEADDEAGNPVAVINEATRQRFFGDGPALGRSVDAGGQQLEVVGVVRNVSMLRKPAYGDIYAPIGASRSDSYRELWMGGFSSMVLARSRAEFSQVQDEFRVAIADLEIDLPNRSPGTMHGRPLTKFEHFSYGIVPTSRDEDPPVELALIIVGAAALMFMMLPAMNLVNLNMSRILERASEIGVRKAFGAASSQLVTQFVVENVILSVVGGAIGLLLAIVTMAVVNDAGWIPHAAMRPNLRIFGYGIGFSVLFGCLSGVYPAYRMSRMHPVDALRGGRQA